MAVEHDEHEGHEAARRQSIGFCFEVTVFFVPLVAGSVGALPCDTVRIPSDRYDEGQVVKRLTDYAACAG